MVSVSAVSVSIEAHTCSLYLSTSFMITGLKAMGINVMLHMGYLFVLAELSTLWLLSKAVFLKDASYFHAHFVYTLVSNTAMTLRQRFCCISQMSIIPHESFPLVWQSNNWTVQTHVDSNNPDLEECITDREIKYSKGKPILKINVCYCSSAVKTGLL